MRLLLIGAPGSGKGTQGARLADRYGVEHIAAGDLLRAEVASGSDLGTRLAALLARGELVPDQVILDIIMPRVFAAAAARGYVLDGFPRTIAQAAQARAMAEATGSSVRRAVLLQAPQDLLVQRLLRRAVLEGRADDTESVIAHRLQVFAEATAPVLDFYRERGLLIEVDATQEPEQVYQAIADRLPPLVRAAPIPG